MSTQVIERDMQYHTKEGVLLKSFLALPEGLSQPAPCVVVAPEWWGLTEHPKNMARQLAKLGYVALALDVYGEGKTTQNPGEAAALMNELLENHDELMNRALTGTKALHELPETCRSNMAAFGYCFGGKIALDLARSGLPLKAVATFHGNLSADKPAQSDQFTAEVLVAQGAKDAMIDTDLVARFEEEMKNAGVTYRIDTYEGAGHGFTNPNIDALAAKHELPLAYNQAAAQTSWTRAVELLERTLEK